MEEPREGEEVHGQQGNQEGQQMPNHREEHPEPPAGGTVVNVTQEAAPVPGEEPDGDGEAK